MNNNHLHWLADSIAAIVVISVVLFVGLAVGNVFGATLTGISATWFGLYSFIVLMSATKLYGKSVYDAVKGVGKGLIGQPSEPIDTTDDSRR